MSERYEHQQLYDLMQKQVMNLFQEGTYPMTLFGIETKTLKEALPTELPMISDYSIDYGFLDEENDLHHVEFQTDFKEEYVYRFSTYHTLLRSKYKKKVNRIFTYIIFHSKVEPAEYKVKAMQLTDGGDQSFTPTVIFMKNEKLSKEAEKVWDKVRTCKHIELKQEELAMLIYSMFGDMDRSFLEVATELLTISDKFANEDQQKMLAGCVVSLSNRILKKEEFKKIEGMLNGMGQLLEKFGNDMYIERLIQKAVEHLSNGKSEVLIQEFLGLNDEEMERAKELYERTKKRQ
ncbi:hypothetical protein ACS2B2_25765 [Bacillus cereus group sp. BceL297]|uniref:hypothetical protein n=1 Tax=unclassified Bacillus cereus group TaxID=2750818 RepID=UPI003F1EE929